MSYYLNLIYIWVYAGPRCLHAAELVCWNITYYSFLAICFGI